MRYLPLLLVAACSVDPGVGIPKSDVAIAGAELSDCGASIVGPFVSATRCDSAKQCGTQQYPWCTIARALEITGLAKIQVATAADDVVTLRDGVTIEGGWDADFTVRELDATKSPTLLRSISFPAGVTATLDGARLSIFRMPSDTSPLPQFVAPIVVESTARATLRRVAVTALNDTPLATNTAALAAAGASNVEVGEGCVLDGLPAVNDSAGVRLRDDFTGALVVRGFVEGGKGKRSIGVLNNGKASVTIDHGGVQGGTGGSGSYGLVLGGDAASTTRVVDSTVRGGKALAAFAVSYVVGAELTIERSQIDGGGLALKDARATAVFADRVSRVRIVDSTITGSSVTGGEDPQQSVGIDLIGDRLAGDDDVPASAPSTEQALITGSRIDGGGQARIRVGVRTQTVPLEVRASDVAGTRSKGRPTSFGIAVYGRFFPGERVVIADNSSITGGDAQPSTFDWYQYARDATAIRIVADAQVVIENNRAIIGCPFTDCQGESTAIWMLNHSGHAPDLGHYIRLGMQAGSLSVVGNGHIEGGPGITRWGTGGKPSGSFGIFANHFDAILPVRVANNDLIAGNLTASSKPFSAIGIYGRSVHLTIEDNKDVRGGFGSQTSSGESIAGVRVDKASVSVNGPTLTNTVIARRNMFSGGSDRGTGAMFLQQKGRIERNVMHSCGADIACNNGGPGLIAAGNDQTVIANNFVWGGTIGCAINQTWTFDTWSQWESTTIFVHNFCASLSNWHSTGAVVFSGLDPAGKGSVMSNNIFDSGPTTEARAAYEGYYAFDQKWTVQNNAFVSKGDLPGQWRRCVIGSFNSNTVCEQDLSIFKGPKVSGNIVITDPGYAAADWTNRTPAGFSQSSACKLGGLATPIVSEDYFGDPRGVAPEIGPDECP